MGLGFKKNYVGALSFVKAKCMISFDKLRKNGMSNLGLKVK